MRKIDKNNWELFNSANLGSNVREVIETQECKILRVEDKSGEGTMTMYSVFDGVYLIFQSDKAERALGEAMPSISVDLKQLTGKLCVGEYPVILRKNETAERIFSELSYMC